MNILEEIQSQLRHLSESERKVVEVVLVSPDNAIHSSIVALALKANVGKPTVSRSRRSMDTRGFPDFKLRLTRSLANDTPYVSRNVNEDDSVESYTEKIFKSVMTVLDHTCHSLDESAINRAVDLLTRVKKIAFFGLGSSTAAAYDAMNKFFRFNVPVVYSSDIVLQRTSYMNYSDGNVVVLISHTGRTKNLVELTQPARESGAMVTALTSTGTPLTREATLAITLDVPEDTDIYTPMVSRLIQLTVIGVLTTGFTLWRGTKFRDNLKRIKGALKESRFDKQLLSLSDDR